VDAIIGQPGPSLAALLITAAGVPFYLIWARLARLSAENVINADAGESG
jgi:hypothetical protein